ncbi:MAG: PilN domain-containing protein [Pseudomonadota bacterium]|nr:PilN domain-containing protein [Pseudomonadota bacterium]
MAHVNLLPWRAERRKQREREFYMQLVAAFVVGLGVLLIWIFWMGQRIDNQDERNTYLQTEIKQLDVRNAKIKDLEKVRAHLLARKQIIEQLQADRSQMVHLFDELVKTIPSSARLSAMKQNGQSMSLDGVAQSNASVAEYMRNIETSPWMGHAELRKTENTHDASRMPYTFGLNVSLSRPKTDEAAGKSSIDSTDASPLVTPASDDAPAPNGAAAATTTPSSPKPAAPKQAAAASRSTTAPVSSAAAKGGART